MAPPHERPGLSRKGGFSRKAQFGLFSSYVAAISGAAIGFVLLVVSLIHPTAFAFARAAANDVAAPAGRISATGRSSSKSIIDVISGYIAAGSKNARMEEELKIARSKLAEAEAVASENRRLKALLAVRETDGQAVTAARLIGSSSTSTRRFALLGAGKRDGVLVGQPVRSATGLVGRVLEVGNRTARVLLITDGESVVPVRRVKGDIAGFAQGQADGTLIIRLIDLGINPLKKGDVFVTSGSGGLYRPNVPVAVVRSVTRDGAVARIVSDPAASEFVLVEPIWQPITELRDPVSGDQPS
ncbi:rod shape-determining protein MreC [Croceicoccus naphthovorans]|uniref:Cell shape-determining protein MreC n=1 Tax=Croceicoccus naphthovorans TaxID=1348774 RepID=A0A0G3XHL2_9SPHN|nr:rod shape-determining protein MreC [Croceicoccus naphthovorans]AKM10084.1 rod shape-determining protein MreC [Croceicoccus naphthovorans]MBB3991196.1 rod shape-determining protein MreC [Croceicoccus naphthovorans]